MSVETAPTVPATISASPSINSAIGIPNEANFSFNPSFSGEIHPVQIGFEPKQATIELPNFNFSPESFNPDRTVPVPEIIFNENLFGVIRPKVEGLIENIEPEIPFGTETHVPEAINVQDDALKGLEIRKDEELLDNAIQKMEEFGFTAEVEEQWKMKLERARLNSQTNRPKMELISDDIESEAQRLDEFADIEVLKPILKSIDIQTETQTEEQVSEDEIPEIRTEESQIEDSSEKELISKEVIPEIPQPLEEPNWDMYHIKEIKIVDSNSVPIKTELDIKFVGRKKHSELEYPAQKLASNGANHLVFKNGKWEATKSPARQNPIEADKVKAA